MEQRLGRLPINIVALGSSADGLHMALVAKKGQEWIVVVDGQKGPEFDDIGQGTLVFSADGKQLAYAAKQCGKWLIVVDDQAGPEYNGISLRVFDDDGTLEFLAHRDKILCRVTNTK